MNLPRTLKETLLALFLVAAGCFVLPILVYLVGNRLLGQYEGGLPAFYEAIGTELLAIDPFAWLLVLSPLLCVQLARFWLWLRRQRRRVT